MDFKKMIYIPTFAARKGDFVICYYSRSNYFKYYLMIMNDNGHLINMAPYRNLFIILGEIILLTVGRDFFVTIYCIWMSHETRSPK